MVELDLELFCPVTLADKKIILPLLLANDVFFCDYNFVNLYIWGDIFKTSWRLQDDRLWIYNGHDDLMLLPVGKPLSLPELVSVSDQLIQSGKSGNFVLVDHDFVANNPGLKRFFNLQTDIDNGDYIYSSQKLVNLRGNKLHKKRNLIEQFKDQYPHYTSQPLQSSDLPACLALSEKWCQQRNCLELDFVHETSALKKALADFSELELQGIKIMLGEELCAFSIFSPLNGNMADVHFEKFAPDIKGASQVINWETAKFLAEKYKYINREQDLGIEGLRQAKKSYDPEYIVSAYLLLRLP
jgi:hypothetical protein